MVEAYRPDSLQEILTIRLDTGATLFAGGTDLMVRHRKPAGALPSVSLPVIFLDNCDELKGIRQEDGFLEIGAATTMTELVDSPLVHTMIKRILLEIAAPALRNVATLGGNICNASPAADTLPYLYTVDADLRLASCSGERVVPVTDFIQGPGIIDLADDEVLTSVRVPESEPAVWEFRKVGTRRANALTKVSFTATAEVDGGTVTSAAFALGAVAPTVIRLPDLEQQCRGADSARLSDVVESVEDLCGDLIRPIDDQRSSAAYRKTVALRLISRFLTTKLAGALS